MFGYDAYVLNLDRGKYESETLACVYLRSVDVDVDKAHLSIRAKRCRGEFTKD